ncbi:MAG: hypothetical protein LUH22_01560 [Bacteroides sp.]|nr:hypothetical protein [Bacteroides sp.]
MRIAVFIDDIYLIHLMEEVKHIFLFDVDDGVIIALGEELIKIKDINYICLWLLGKRAETVYYDNFTETERMILEKSGITVKSMNEIRTNPVLHALVIKSGS